MYLTKCTKYLFSLQNVHFSETWVNNFPPMNTYLVLSSIIMKNTSDQIGTKPLENFAIRLTFRTCVI